MTALGLPMTARRALQPDEARGSLLGGARQVAQAWFGSLAAGHLDPQTHPDIVLVLHGSGARLDGVPERFEGPEAVAAVLAGMGPARWEIDEALAEDQRAALRGTVCFPDGRAAAFAAFVTLRNGQVVRVERHLDRIPQQAPAV